MYEKLGGALRGEIPQQNNSPRISPVTPTVYDVPKVSPRQRFYNEFEPSEFGIGLMRPAPHAPIHGKKRTYIRYREDWNADGSAWNEVHDLIANGDSPDPDVLAHMLITAGKMIKGQSKLARDAASRARLASGGAILSEVLTPAPTVSGESQPWQPKTTRRELLQRMSRKQRKVYKAYQLWREGKTWREIAKEMEVTEAVAYGWYHEIRSMLGRAVTTRNVDLPRDENRRFVGCSRIVQK